MLTKSSVEIFLILNERLSCISLIPYGWREIRYFKILYGNFMTFFSNPTEEGSPRTTRKSLHCVTTLAADLFLTGQTMYQQRWTHYHLTDFRCIWLADPKWLFFVLFPKMFLWLGHSLWAFLHSVSKQGRSHWVLTLSPAVVSARLPLSGRVWERKISTGN